MEVTAQRIFLVLLGVVMGYAIRVVVSRREEERRIPSTLGGVTGERASP